MAALATAQGQFPDIERNRTVTVTPRNGGASYQFKYATLSAILHAVKKPLADNGIAYMQIITHDSDRGFYVLTTSFFCGDEFISSEVPLIVDGGNATNQQFGSALTYMKRYAFAAMLGIAADEDDDGNAADGNEIKAVADKVAKRPNAPAPDPISTSPRRMEMEVPPDPPKDAPKSIIPPDDVFDGSQIDVPTNDAGDQPNWMAWGQSFMGMARVAPDAKSLEKLEKNNATPMKNMETGAPKMFANLSLALIKVRKALETK